MPDACTPRARYAERTEAAKAAAQAAEAQRWHDPFTELERWFTRLPNMELEEICGCGSGKPIVYWSPEDGTNCADCKHMYSIYIPSAVMWNICQKFGIPEDIQKKILDKINEEEEQYRA